MVGLLFVIASTPTLGQGIQGGDVTPPAPVAFSPANGASNVDQDIGLAITFDENITREIAGFRLRRASDDSLIVSYSQTNQIQASNNTLTIALPRLPEETEMYVEIDPGLVLDLAGNPWAGISDSTTWRFTTGDTQRPELVQLTPENEERAVPVDSSFTLTLDEGVVAAAGNVSLYQGQQVVAFDEDFDLDTQFAGADQFSSNGANTYTGISNGAGGGFWGTFMGQPSVPPASLPAYTGFTGSFLATSDSGQAIANSAAGLPVNTPTELLWSNIDISGLTNLSFDGFFAAQGPLEPADFMLIEVQIDSGGFTPLLSLRGDGKSLVRVDSDYNGLGDGPVVGLDARRFFRPIPGTGSVLDLRLVTRTTAGGERMAADRLRITGISGSPTLVEQVAISDPSVTIAGDTITFDPATTLMDEQRYFIIVDEGALVDDALNANPFPGVTSSAQWRFLTGDVPSGYGASFDLPFINAANAGSASFSLSNADPGAIYDFLITSSGGPGSANGNGFVAAPTEQFSVDLSGLPDGTLTLELTLSDINGVGPTATDTVLNDQTAPAISEVIPVPPVTLSTTPSLTLDLDESGQLSVEGSCGSPDEGATAAGQHVITLSAPDNSSPLPLGVYEDCSVEVIDGFGNTGTLGLSSFRITVDDIFNDRFETD